MNQNIEAALRKSTESIFSNENHPLLQALRLVRPNLQRAYILNWIPEQSEDIYDVLVDKDTVCTVEVQRNSVLIPGSGKVKACRSVHEYRLKNRSKEKNRKLDVALKII